MHAYIAWSIVFRTDLFSFAILYSTDPAANIWIYPPGSFKAHHNTSLETASVGKPLAVVQVRARGKNFATVQIGAHREGFQHVVVSYSEIQS